MSRPSPSRFRRAVLTAVGLLFTALAIIGVFLPLVPTTPFLLVAVWCFARSSPRLHRWIVSNRHVGPYLEEWRLHRTVPRAAKRKAFVLVLIGFTCSALILQEPWMRAATIVFGCVVLGIVAWLPSSRPGQYRDPGAGSS